MRAATREVEWYSRSFPLLVPGRTGEGTAANGSVLLDTITNAQGSTLFRGSALWQGLALGLSGQVLQVAASKPAWNFITGANFAAQSANHFLAGPASGASATPTFRDINSLDLDPLLGQYPGTAGNTAASSGNIGEFIANSNTVALTSGAPADIASIALSPGDWDVWANFSTSPAAGTTTSVVRAWINTTSATDPGAPNGEGISLAARNIRRRARPGFAGWHDAHQPQCGSDGPSQRQCDLRRGHAQRRRIYRGEADALTLPSSFSPCRARAPRGYRSF